MFLISFLRVIKFSLQDVIRNIWLSLVIVIILALALFSVNMLLTVKVIGQAAIDAVREKVDVNLFLKSDAKEDEILALKARVSNLESVRAVEYVSKEAAITSFREEHRTSPEILAALNELGKNPLSPTLVIKPSNLDSLDELTARLNAIDDPIIESRNFANYRDMLDKINGITVKVSEVGLMVSSIFVLITILVVYNSVRVAIYTHRREIMIMRLVGASNWFIKTPFVLSGWIYSFIGLALVASAYFVFLALLQPYLETFFIGYNIDIIAYFRENFVTIFGLEFLVACLVNTIASLSALRVYSKI